MEKAKSLAATEPLKAIELYKNILAANDYRAEDAVYGLAECFKTLKNVGELSELVRSCQKLNLAKAKIQKLFRVLILVEVVVLILLRALDKAEAICLCDGVNLGAVKFCFCAGVNLAAVKFCFCLKKVATLNK